MTGLIQNTQTNCSTTPAATVSKTPLPFCACIYPPHTCSFTMVHPCLHDNSFTHLSPWLPPCMLVSLAMAQHSATSFAHSPIQVTLLAVWLLTSRLDVNTSYLIFRYLSCALAHFIVSPSLKKAVYADD